MRLLTLLSGWPSWPSLVICIETVQWDSSTLNTAAPLQMFKTQFLTSQNVIMFLQHEVHSDSTGTKSNHIFQIQTSEETNHNPNICNVCC